MTNICHNVKVTAHEFDQGWTQALWENGNENPELPLSLHTKVRMFVSKVSNLLRKYSLLSRSIGKDLMKLQLTAKHCWLCESEDIPCQAACVGHILWSRLSVNLAPHNACCIASTLGHPLWYLIKPICGHKLNMKAGKEMGQCWKLQNSWLTWLPSPLVYLIGHMTVCFQRSTEGTAWGNDRIKFVFINHIYQTCLWRTLTHTNTDFPSWKLWVLHAIWHSLVEFTENRKTLFCTVYKSLWNFLFLTC